MRLEPSRLWDGDDGGRAVDSRTGGVDDARAVELGHDLEEVHGRVHVVLVVRERDLSRLADGLVRLRRPRARSAPSHLAENMRRTHRDVDDTPDSTLSILLEHLADLVALREVSRERVDLRAVLVLLGRVGR